MKTKDESDILSEEERREIGDLTDRYPRKRAASIEALKLVQRRHGWVSDDLLEELAVLLEMTPEELDSVATFYNLIYRRPVGRHVILLCDSVSCWVVGHDDCPGHLKKRLEIDFGETTSDGRFTLLPMACLGVCEQAPAMMIDEDLHTGLTPQKLDRILEEYE
jgi:NADH-quinone oxidoreductase subunit E